MTGGHIRNRRALKSKTTNNTSITGIFDIGEKDYIYYIYLKWLKVILNFYCKCKSINSSKYHYKF